VVDRQTFWNAGGWSPEVFQLDLHDASAETFGAHYSHKFTEAGLLLGLFTRLRP
jgi:hypothetical protein